jgi:hypothetical protein
MTNFTRNTLVVCGFAAFLAAAVPALAETVVIGRYPSVGPYGAPYRGDAHAPRHRFGTDPDPNVRFEMLRTRNWRKG